MQHATCALAATGAAALATAGADVFAGVLSVEDDSADPSPDSAERRSFERFSRCSGISVTVIL